MVSFIKKMSMGVLSSAMIASMLLQSPFTQLKAADTGEKININKTADNITIGNEYISRSFSTKGNKVSTTEIVNKRTAQKDTIFTPGQGSEEFIINMTKDNSTTPQPEVSEKSRLDRSNWSASDDGHASNEGTNGPASMLFDGNDETYYHSAYGPGDLSDTVKAPYPHTVYVDMKEQSEIASFTYQKRLYNSQVTDSGYIKDFDLYMADSLENLKTDKAEKIMSGTFKNDKTSYINLPKTVKTRYIKLVFKSCYPPKSGSSADVACGSEINFYSEEIKNLDIEDNTALKSSDLSLKENGVTVKNTTATINNIAKVGKQVTFSYEPYTFRGVTYTIQENIVMYQGDHFMRKYMKIQVPDDQKELASIDYIDLESLNVNKEDAQWTVPTDAGGVVAMDQYHANLGQPIYIQGMFFGCEFPETETQIVKNTGYMRYYTGKNFTRFEADHQLTKDGSYVTWQTVAGAARSTDNAVIQSDFFTYIDSISTPSEFRTQYNSWFDNMMNIDDENILKSFIEIDKELSKSDVRPLDSYVVDDGWNNYNDTRVVDASRSGTTLNQTGFWEFNSKFPDGLTPSSQLVQNFGSNFGVWVGPRGGYNFFNNLADILTKSNKGSKAGGSVDVADRTYVENFGKMAVTWQKDYKVNYWKWDGFADSGQINQWPATDGVPGRANNHMIGGYEHMYHVTDLWESWIDLFEQVRVSEKDDNINKLWISLTCYVNPSPWFLQWANSVWMQCTGDRGESGSLNGKMNKMLTYRDANYYDFIVNHEFQFPLANIYNHDPIYGTEGTGINANSMTSEEFKNYLYMMATRGTGFWELYYSDSIMTNEKYEVNSEFLNWAEENFHILRNAKIMGDSPAEGVKLQSGPFTVGNGGNPYGFSAWDGEDGIISMRNPDSKARTFTFTLDRNIGASESIQGKTLFRTTVHSYMSDEDSDMEYQTLHYGDKISINLQPGETRIWSLSTEKDTKAPKIDRISSDGNKNIQVKFNEKVTGKLLRIEGAKISKITKSTDGVSYRLELTKSLADGSELSISAEDIKDLSGNSADDKAVALTYHKENKVLETDMQELNGAATVNIRKKTLYGDNGFTVSVKAKTEVTDTVLAEQNQAYSLGINADGFAVLKMNNTEVVSNIAVNDGNEHTITGVKENNGMLKIYIDGTLNRSAYKKANRNYALKASDIKLGSDNFTGSIALQIFDKALGYDEIDKLVNNTSSSGRLDTSGMHVEVSGTAEGSSDNIFDENPTTFWTSDKVEHVSNAAPWMTIDLGGKKIIHQIDYTKRFANQPNAYWKCTGNILNYIVEISDDNGKTWKQIQSGETFDDSTITNMDSGGTTKISFDAVEATNIRLTSTSTYGWNDDVENRQMTVSDIAIYGEKISASNVVKNAEISAKWTKNGTPVHVNEGKPLSNTVDGNRSTDSYADFGEDNKTDSSYLEFDMGSLKDVESVNLYRYFKDGRTYKGTVIALSKTADFSDPDIIYNSDKENFHGLGAGSDDTYAETADGKSIVLDKLTSARYIRIYMHGSNTGNTNHVVELEVMGYDNNTEEEESSLDISTLIERLIEANKINTTDITIESKNMLETTMHDAYTLLSDAQSQEDVDAMSIKLESVMKNLVDTSALKKAIVNAETVYAKKTTDSAKDLKAAIDSSKELLKNGSSVEIRQACIQLQEKQNDPSLVDRADTQKLAEQIDAYVSLNEFDYTVDSWSAYQSVLHDAKALVKDNSNCDQKAADKMLADLIEAKNALKPAVPSPIPADKTMLADTIREAQAINANEMTTSTYNVLTAAQKQANDAMNSEHVDQKQVDKACDTLRKALDALEKRADTQNASALLTAVQKENLNEQDFTAQSWKAFHNALAAIERAVKDNSDINSSTMASLCTELNRAIAQLVKKADKSELHQLYDANKKRTNENYTDASWNTFRVALSRAEAVLGYENADAEQIRDAVNSLNNAVKNLQKKAVTSVPDNDVNKTPVQPQQKPSNGAAAGSAVPQNQNSADRQNVENNDVKENGTKEEDNGKDKDDAKTTENVEANKEPKAKPESSSSLTGLYAAGAVLIVAAGAAFIIIRHKSSKKAL